MAEATKAIDLNSADVDELAELRMVGRDRAEAIIKYHNEHGPFKSWDDLKKVPSFSEGMVEYVKKSGATMGGK